MSLGSLMYTKTMLKFSWVFGHLLASKNIMNSLPKDVHIKIVTAELAHQFQDTNMFYMDLWPFARTMLVTASPSPASKITQVLNLPKPKLLHNTFLPLTGGPNLFTMKEREWKPWRTVFNPGFSVSSIIDQIPHIVKEMQVYYEILKEHAQAQQVFQLDETTLALTIDIIGHVMLYVLFLYFVLK